MSLSSSSCLHTTLPVERERTVSLLHACNAKLGPMHLRADGGFAASYIFLFMRLCGNIVSGSDVWVASSHQRSIADANCWRVWSAGGDSRHHDP